MSATGATRRGWVQARGQRRPVAGTERADQRDEAREDNPRHRAQGHEGPCLRSGSLQHGCDERRDEGAFGRVKAGGDALGRDRARGRLGLGSRACPHDEPVLWRGFEENPGPSLVAPCLGHVPVLGVLNGFLVLGARACGKETQNVSAREVVAAWPCIRARPGRLLAPGANSYLGAGLLRRAIWLFWLPLAARSETNGAGGRGRWGCEETKGARRVQACGVGRSRCKVGRSVCGCAYVPAAGVWGREHHDLPLAQRSHVRSLCCARGARLSHARACVACEGIPRCAPD